MLELTGNEPNKEGFTKIATSTVPIKFSFAMGDCLVVVTEKDIYEIIREKKS